MKFGFDATSTIESDWEKRGYCLTNYACFHQTVNTFNENVNFTKGVVSAVQMLMKNDGVKCMLAENLYVREKRSSRPFTKAIHLERSCIHFSLPYFSNITVAVVSFDEICLGLH